jgi:hypothetical protein
MKNRIRNPFSSRYFLLGGAIVAMESHKEGFQPTTSCDNISKLYRKYNIITIKNNFDGARK